MRISIVQLQTFTSCAVSVKNWKIKSILGIVLQNSIIPIQMCQVSESVKLSSNEILFTDWSIVTNSWFGSETESGQCVQMSQRWSHVSSGCISWRPGCTPFQRSLLIKPIVHFIMLFSTHLKCSYLLVVEEFKRSLNFDPN